MSGVGRGAWVLLLAIPAMTGCYAGPRAAHDVNVSWVGRTRAEIDGRWGRPGVVQESGNVTVAKWAHARHHIELPSGSAHVRIAPGEIDAGAVVRPGVLWTSSTVVTALVDPRGIVTHVDGPSLWWGPPNDVNLHWGTILGLNVGMGRLDSTSTPLPSGGMYIGGMLTPTTGLVGDFSLVSGSDQAGGAMGFVWGMGLQWWPATRVWLRTGPAAVLAFDPGFENLALSPGLASAASIAVVKVGTFVLDLRVDLTVSPSVALGTVGVGVNMN